MIHEKTLEVLRALQNTMISGDLALMFAYMDYLENLHGEEYLSKVLLTLAKESPEAPLMKLYVIPLIVENYAENGGES